MKVKTKIDKLLGFTLILFLIFGITYLDFDNLSFSNHVRPYLMLVLGMVTAAYWLIVDSRSNTKNY
jgi:hypothetical protein